VRPLPIPTDNFGSLTPLNIIMKTSLILIAAATLTPALMLIGVGGTVTFGIVSVIGVCAMMTNDYAPTHSYRHELAKVRVTRNERHPLAA